MSNRFALLWGLFLLSLYGLLVTSTLEPVSDGWWENLEAVVLLLTLALYFVFFPISKGFLFFAAIVLLGLGEEIKWGVGFAFKDFFHLRKVANQMIYFLLGVVITLAVATCFKKVRRICHSILLPTPSLLFAPASLLTLLFEPSGASEAREMILYLVFLGSVIFTLLQWKEAKQKLPK